MTTATPDPVAMLLADLTRHGIELQAVGDALRFRPRNRMTPELSERLKAHKADLLTLLRTTADSADADKTISGAAGPAILSTPDSPSAAYTVGHDMLAQASDVCVQPFRYIADNPIRQRVIDLLLPIHRDDPARAIALRDAWAERLAVVAADEDSCIQAEDLAWAELTDAVGTARQADQMLPIATE